MFWEGSRREEWSNEEENLIRIYSMQTTSRIEEEEEMKKKLCQIKIDCMQTWRIEDNDGEEDMKKKLWDKDWLYADDIKNRGKKEDMKEKLSDEDWLHADNKKTKRKVKKSKKKKKKVDEEMK